MQIIFTGSGEFGVPTLRALVGGGHRIVQVVSQPDRPAGRGRELTPTPISQLAIAEGMPLERIDNINALKLPSADLMVVIAFGQKIADPVVHHPRLGSINLHASRLPKYRGAAPINWAIIKGEEITGNSVIRLAQKMDAGAVLRAIWKSASAPPKRLCRRTARPPRRGRQSPGPESHRPVGGGDGGRDAAGSAPWRRSPPAFASRRARGSISSQPAIDYLARRIRGFHPWPGCRVKLADAAGSELAQPSRLVRPRRPYSNGRALGTGRNHVRRHNPNRRRRAGNPRVATRRPQDHDHGLTSAAATAGRRGQVVVGIE